MAPNSSPNTMSFNEQNQIDQDSEENHIEKEDDAELKVLIDRSDKSTVSLCFSNVPLKFNLLQLLFLMKYYINQLYIFVWRKYEIYLFYC